MLVHNGVVTAQAANGTITGMTPGTPGGAGDRLQQTTALALWLQTLRAAQEVTHLPTYPPMMAWLGLVVLRR